MRGRQTVADSQRNIQREEDNQKGRQTDANGQRDIQREEDKQRVRQTVRHTYSRFEQKKREINIDTDIQRGGKTGRADLQ
jgi:hypothetical protein